MNGALHNRRILVTGGTSGIGKAIATSAARAGADVAFCGLSEEGAAETVREVEQAERRVFFRALDLSDLSAARRFARDAIDHLGGLDGLVNNAGANFFHGVLEAKQEDIERCFAVDFYPAWAISQEVYPALKAAGGGVIVNVASVHAERTSPGAFPYNAAKAALVALTKSQALEWGEDNIRAVAVAPGLILTPLADTHFAEFNDPEAERHRLEQTHPVGHAGRSADVASLIVYLLSDANTFISGNTILVDGAVSAKL